MNTMSQKRNKNQREKESARKVRAAAKHKKDPLQYVMKSLRTNPRKGNSPST